MLGRTRPRLAWKHPVVIGLGSLGAIALYDHNFNNEKWTRGSKLVFKSGFRILNIVSTATVMGCDYGYHFYINKSKKQNDIEYEELNKALEVVQARQETVAVQLLLEEIPKEQQSDAEKEIESLAKQINEISAKMAALLQKGDDIHSAIHKRNAQRLTSLCAWNGGLYIKVGQHISMLDYVIPPEYQKSLSTLLASTPQSTYAQVRRVVFDDLGKYPEEIFDSIEPVPIASASLAQVHIAYKDGKKYAVKVQHDGLYDSSTVDMWVITLCVDILAMIFKDFNYQWLSKEMNLNLPLELNFQVEQANVARCAENLKEFIARGDVAVPIVNKEASNRRVITMSFEDGCYVTNAEQVNELKLCRSQISQLISEVFCHQIFRDGFVHCDPHEANILVRPHPSERSGADGAATGSRRPQIVLLDHGLYRQLTDQFRRDYCRLWQGLVLSDKDKIKHYCERMNAGPAYTLLAAMITRRPWNDIVSDDIDRLHFRGADVAADNVMLRAWAEKYFVRIVKLLGEVPSDLLLLLKTSDCLRHLDNVLDVPVNTTAVAGNTVADVLLEEDIQTCVKTLQDDGNIVTSSYQFYSAMHDWCNVKTRIFVYKRIQDSLHYLRSWFV